MNVDPSLGLPRFAGPVLALHVRHARLDILPDDKLTLEVLSGELVVCRDSLENFRQGDVVVDLPPTYDALSLRLLEQDCPLYITLLDMNELRNNKRQQFDLITPKLSLEIEAHLALEKKQYV